VLGVRRWRELVIGKNWEVLFDRPKPTAGCSANGRSHPVVSINFIKIYYYQSTQPFIVNYVYYSDMFRLTLNTVVSLMIIGFGGLKVACWPLVPKFAGSHPAEAVGIFRAKKFSALRRGSKVVGPMS
jgi:hypothetical protein